MITNLILLQAQQTSAGGGASMWIWMILLLVLMWLLLIRPQQKQAKKEEQFRKGLKKGDRVMFSGGIYGKVHEINDTTIDVEISHEVIVTVEKSFIQPVVEQQVQNQKKK